MRCRSYELWFVFLLSFFARFVLKNRLIQSVAVKLPYCGRAQNFAMHLLHFVCVLYSTRKRNRFQALSMCMSLHLKHLCALDAFFMGHRGFEIYEKSICFKTILKLVIFIWNNWRSSASRETKTKIINHCSLITQAISTFFPHFRFYNKKSLINKNHEILTEFTFSSDNFSLFVNHKIFNWQNTSNTCMHSLIRSWSRRFERENRIKYSVGVSHSDNPNDVNQ